jgi:hypothetical protein
MNQPIAFQSLIGREIPPLPEPLIPRMFDLFEVARGMRVRPDLARLWRQASVTQFPTLGFSAVAVGALAMEFDVQRPSDRARMAEWLRSGRGTMSRRVADFLRGSDFASPRAVREMQELASDRGGDLLDRLENLNERPDYVQRWVARHERGAVEAIRTVLYLIGGRDLDADIFSLCRVIDNAHARKRALIAEPTESWPDEGEGPPHDEHWSWYKHDWLWPINRLP